MLPMRAVLIEDADSEPGIGQSGSGATWREAQPAPPPKTHLKAGDAAPEVSLRTTAGNTFKLSEQRGKTVVLAFFPAAFTGG